MSEPLMTAVHKPPAPAPPLRRVPGPWLALLGAPVSLGSTTPTLILPQAAGSLGVSSQTVIWIVTTYALGISVGTPLMAGLLRRIGFSRTMLAAAALALAGAALVLVAPWLALLLPGRALQAIGAAGLTTAAMNLAGSTRRMGLITAGIGLCAALGPLAGSLIGDRGYLWRPAICLSLVGILAVPAALRRAPAQPAAGDRTFDVSGAVRLVALATALVFIPRFPLPASLVALAAAVLLGLHVRARPDGFVPVTVLRAAAFVPVCLLALALATSYFGLLYGVPRLLEHRVHWSTGQIGPAQLGALALGSAGAWAFTTVAARLRRGTAVLALPVLGGAALATTVLSAGLPWALLGALGVAMLTSSGGQATLVGYANRDVPVDQQPVGIGLFNLCYQLGGTFGPAIVTLLPI